MTPHKWDLIYDREVPAELSRFPQQDIDQIFAKIRELLVADNPKEVHRVEALVGKRCRGQYRLRYGDYRIRFIVEPGEIVKFKSVYKGYIRIVAIKNRREAYDDC